MVCRHGHRSPSREHGAAAVAQGGFPDWTERDVIRPGFARADAFVAGLAAGRADDGIGQILAHLADGSCAIGQVDAVKAEPFDHQDMVFDHDGDVAGMGDFADRIPGAQDGVAAVYEEMRQAMAGAIAGISWSRLLAQSSVTYPCLSESDPGQPIVFQERFPTSSGRVRLVPAGLVPANEQPDADYPWVLITGRQLEHWHTGSMTRRTRVLDALEPQATVSMNGRAMARLGVQAGDCVEVRSRRGLVRLQVRRDDGTPDHTVFIPFAYREAAANLLTNAALDPFGKIPELKYCAVQILRVA